MLHLGYLFSMDFDYFEKKSSLATVGDRGIGCHWTRKQYTQKISGCITEKQNFHQIKFLSFLSDIVLYCKVTK